MLSRSKYYVSCEKAISFSSALPAREISHWDCLGLDEALTKKFAQMTKAIRDSSDMDNFFKIGVTFVVAQLLRNGMDWDSVNLMIKTKFGIDLNQFLPKTEENGEDIVLVPSVLGSASPKVGVKLDAKSMEDLIQKVNESRLIPDIQEMVINFLRETYGRGETLEWFEQKIYQEFGCDFNTLMEVDLQS